MRLRNFLIIAGLWVALLPHIGFSIATENVLFSITGFLLIVASFYVAAVEDRHQHKRIIKDGNIQANAKKTLNKLRTIKKSPVSKSVESHVPEEAAQIKSQPKSDAEVVMSEQDEKDTGPRIRKAVSDVKINMDSLDDIVS